MYVPGFPFGLDLAAINIQRGRDHGIQPYVSWRIPCGLTPVREWADLNRIMGPASTHRLRKAYRSVEDIDLFVGGLAERPVVGGIVGPTFSCIIAQQFSNLRKGDRFWYENPGFESSFTPAQLDSIRQVAFSQILCRALGGGTLQPHVFLPNDNGPNERLPCSSKLMAPIDLEPWTERDPFARPNDTPNTGPNENLIDLETAPTSFSTTSTTRRPTKVANVVSNVDFIPNANTGLHIPPNGQILLNFSKPATAVNNKLDLSSVMPGPATSTTQSAQTTRPPPQKEPFLTASTAINNKLDLTATTVPPKRKPTRKTTPKRRPTPSNNIANNVDLSLKRDSTNNSTKVNINVKHKLTRRDLSFINLSKLFTNDDNATLLSTKNIALRRGYYQSPAPPPSDYDDVNNYDYNADADPPVYIKPGYGHNPGYQPTTEPPYPHPYYGGGGYYTTTEAPPPHPPYCVYNCYNPPPMTTYNPYGIDTRRPLRKTTPRRGLPTKLTNVDYEHVAQIRQTTKKQQRTTTIRTVFQRPGLIVINDNRPNDKPIFLSSSSLPSISPSSNAHSTSASQSVFSVDPRPEFSSRPIAQQSIPSPIFSQKNSHGQDRSSSKKIMALEHDNDYDSSIPDLERPLNIHEHDGYLRPEQNKYNPLKKIHNVVTYRNYSLYNTGKTATNYEIPANETLWTDIGIRRYAERHQQIELLDLDDNMDQFVGPYIDQDRTHILDPDDDQLDDYSDEYDTDQNTHVNDNVDLTDSEADAETADTILTMKNASQETDSTNKLERFELDITDNTEENTKPDDSGDNHCDYVLYGIQVSMIDKTDNTRKITDLERVENPTDIVTGTDVDNGNMNKTTETNVLDKPDNLRTTDKTWKCIDIKHDFEQTDMNGITKRDNDEGTLNKHERTSTNVSYTEEMTEPIDDELVRNTSNEDSYDETDLNAHNYQINEFDNRDKVQDHVGPALTNAEIDLNRPEDYIIEPAHDQTILKQKLDFIDPAISLDFEDTFARTSNRHAIQSILSDKADDSQTRDNDELMLTSTSDDEQQSTEQKQTKNEQQTQRTSLDHQTSTTVNEKRRKRPTANDSTKQLQNEQQSTTTLKNKRPTNVPRKRRPTNSRRPPTNNLNQQSNHAHNDRRQPGIALVPFVLLTSIDR